MTTEDGTSNEFDILEGTHGPGCIAISDLYKKTGHFTYDPGYGATGSCKSGISFINGEEGICCTVATRSISWRRKAHTWKFVTC